MRSCISMIQTVALLLCTAVRASAEDVQLVPDVGIIYQEGPARSDLFAEYTVQLSTVRGPLESLFTRCLDINRRYPLGIQTELANENIKDEQVLHREWRCYIWLTIFSSKVPRVAIDMLLPPGCSYGELEVLLDTLSGKCVDFSYSIADKPAEDRVAKNESLCRESIVNSLLGMIDEEMNTSTVDYLHSRMADIKPADVVLHLLQRMRMHNVELLDELVLIFEAVLAGEAPDEVAESFITTLIKEILPIKEISSNHYKTFLPGLVSRFTGTGNPADIGMISRDRLARALSPVIECYVESAIERKLDSELIVDLLLRCRDARLLNFPGALIGALRTCFVAGGKSAKIDLVRELTADAAALNNIPVMILYYLVRGYTRESLANSEECMDLLLGTLSIANTRSIIKTLASKINRSS